MDDYKERCKKEYNELCERISKLEDMLCAHYRGVLDFEPTCPPYLLQLQLDAMREYRDILEARNYIEHMW